MQLQIIILNYSDLLELQSEWINLKDQHFLVR